MIGAHAGPWVEAAMFAPAFLVVGVAIVRALTNSMREEPRCHDR